MQDKIIVKKAREHNLKDVSVELPRNKLIVFTGLSGSGKSSLAFDTIFAEGQRRYVESLSAYARQFLGQMKKPDVDEISGLSPAISIDQKSRSSNPRSTVATITEIYDYLRVMFARIGKPHCPDCGHAIQKLSAEEMVDFIMSEAGEAYADPQFVNKRKKTLQDTLVLAPAVRGRKGEYHQMLYDFSQARINGRMRVLRNKIVLDRNSKHDIELAVATFQRSEVTGGEQDYRVRLAEAVETALTYGDGTVLVVLADGRERLLSSQFSCASCGFAFPEIEPRLFSFNSPYGACQVCHGLGTETLFSDTPCADCQGKRLRRESLSVLIGGHNIVSFTGLNIERSAEFLDGLDLNERELEISVAVLKEIRERLQFLLDVGLHYLTLDRRAGTLSGGESQRIRLASQIGSKLVGALYVLDEPSIGLHQRDNDRLLKTLQNLRDLGNTILVVEHDEDTMLSADYLVEFGPGAGVHGGEITAAGPTPDIFDHPTSLTMKYLRGERSIPVPAKRKVKETRKLKVVQASENNLKNVNVEIPLSKLVCVTGVSGSGKSTLIHDVIYQAAAKRIDHRKVVPGRHKDIQGFEYLDRVIMVDQGPIGRTPRSNPATYSGAWGPIRELFATTEESRFRGWKPGRFSFNRPGGRCEHCEGNGTVSIEMHFLPTVYVTCDVCRGTRFDRETLEVKYRGKSIHDVLKMTLEEATEFFEDIPPVYDKLSMLCEVGLGYLEVGQSATTLSGGEAQRVKLAYELAKRGGGKTLYILDEPTTGLHFEDVRRLLDVIGKLVERGHSVIIIEHNLDVIKSADYIVDLGPEGGERGGQVVATGTPEEVAKYSDSWTAKYLKRALKM
jgi:excinuclease ABC subunit A